MKTFLTGSRLFVLILGLLLSAAGLPAFGADLSVFVSIQPQAFVVERIGGERVTVSVLVPPGRNPATFCPSPVKMARLSRSKIFFRVGVPFEEAILPKIENAGDNLRIVDTRHGISLRKMTHAAVGTSAGKKEGGRDPHFWLNPLLVKKQAQTVTNALCRADPDHCREYRANCRALEKDLDALHRRIKAILKPVRGEPFFVFHPAFGYFADAYGLRQLAVEVEGKAPRGRQLAELIRLAGEKQGRVIFVQPQFDAAAAEKIAQAIDGKVVSLNPLAKNYMKNLEQMAIKIKKALKSGEE